jgi:cytochrome oxidase Cu insertion factor (SCO1/SenC/PrrC family)
MVHPTIQLLSVCTLSLTTLFFSNAVGAAPTIGQLAPTFSLKDLSGKTVQLSDFRGKTVAHSCKSTMTLETCPTYNASTAKK